MLTPWSSLNSMYFVLTKHIMVPARGCPWPGISSYDLVAASERQMAFYYQVMPLERKMVSRGEYMVPLEDCTHISHNIP